jgi:hypothetical protein
VPEQDNSARHIASAAIMARQIRLLVPILLVLAAMTAVCIVINFGGFA